MDTLSRSSSQSSPFFMCNFVCNFITKFCTRIKTKCMRSIFYKAHKSRKRLQTKEKIPNPWHFKDSGRGDSAGIRTPIKNKDNHCNYRVFLFSCAILCAIWSKIERYALLKGVMRYVSFPTKQSSAPLPQPSSFSLCSIPNTQGE